MALPQVFPERIRRLLEADEAKALCSVSLLECAILHRLGRLDLEGALSRFFSVALAGDLEVLELTAAIAAKTNEFARDFPGDPFDRTIAATAAILA